MDGWSMQTPELPYSLECLEVGKVLESQVSVCF